MRRAWAMTDICRVAGGFTLAIGIGPSVPCGLAVCPN